MIRLFLKSLMCLILAEIFTEAFSSISNKSNCIHRINSAYAYPLEVDPQLSKDLIVNPLITQDTWYNYWSNSNAHCRLMTSISKVLVCFLFEHKWCTYDLD